MPSDIEILDYHAKSAQTIYDLFDGAGGIYIGSHSDGQDVFHFVLDSKTNPLGVKTGDVFKPGSITYEAVYGQKRVSKRIDKSKSNYGVGYFAVGIPIHNEGRLIGAYSLVTPTTVQDELMNITDTFVSIVDQVARASESVAQSSTALANTVAELVRSTEQANERAGAANEVVVIIRDISSQTHLLGLNGAIQAAQTGGDNGRAFGVVAEETRKLSDRAKENAKSIADDVSKIQSSLKDIQTAVESIGTESQSQAALAEELSAMMASVKESTERIRDIGVSKWF